jgi:small subunit ribosomal protein S9
MTEETTVEVGQGVHLGTGRRKTAVARVRLTRGDGHVKVNGSDMSDYFHCDRQREAVLAPLKATKTLGKFDVNVTVHGSGPMAQSGAVLLGVARALRKAVPDLEHDLREGGYLTRDARKVERKKYGRRGARRSFQFSKR